MSESWNYERFGDLFDYENKSKIKAGDGLQSGLFPFYTSSVEQTKFIDQSQFNRTSLIFGTGGNASIHFCDSLFSVSTDCLVAFPKDETQVYPRFVYFYISGNMQLLEDGFKGAGLKHISKGYINEIQIPLPPLETQKRIADILDAADALRQKDQELLKKYDELAQAIFIDLFGDPVKNEKGWRKYLFSELLLKIESGWSPICLETKASEDEWGVLKLGSITKCKYNENENKALPPSETAKKNLEVRTGDLLFSRKNTHELVAATAYVHKTRPNLMMSDLIFRLVIKDKTQISPIYLHKLLINPNKRSQVQKLANGAAGSMPNISKEKLLNLEIEVPPISLQKQFESYLENIESSKTNAQESIYKSVSLFNSLLQKAFKGELVN